MPPSFASGFIRRREIPFPTFRGWLAFSILAMMAAASAVLLIHPFLAQSRPLGKGILAVEGWMPDYGVRRALEVFRAGGYERMVVTGGPLPPGVACSSYGTYAELSARLLLDLGLGEDSLAAVPSPAVARDRTYAEGLALAAWIDSSGRSIQGVDLVSFSTHSRRSRILFAKALGARADVGVVAVPDLLYDSRKWWKSSQGVKSVIGETIAYIYTRLSFRP